MRISCLEMRGGDPDDWPWQNIRYQNDVQETAGGSKPIWQKAI